MIYELKKFDAIIFRPTFLIRLKYYQYLSRLPFIYCILDNFIIIMSKYSYILGFYYFYTILKHPI